MKTKNNPNGLALLLNVGCLVICGDDQRVFLTADISNPEEYIYVPIMGEYLLEMSYNPREKQILTVPDKNDLPVKELCVVMALENIITEQDLVWVGDEDSGTWAYYPI